MNTNLPFYKSVPILQSHKYRGLPTTHDITPQNALPLFKNYTDIYLRTNSYINQER